MAPEQRYGATDPLQQLLLAVRACDIDRCLAILDSGLDVDTTTTAGCTALMFAVMPDEFGDPTSPRWILELVQALLARGADPKIVDRFGMTAADYARQLIDPDWKDRFGESAVKHWDSEAKAIVGEILALLESSR